MSNYVFFGGSGSGKSVIAVNRALTMAAEQNACVHFFDLDQTKPLFRSRDLDALLAAANISVHCERQFFDAPALNLGVKKFLADRDGVNILDVGGDERGARLIGQFAEGVNSERTRCFYVMNPYRPWASLENEIAQSVAVILRAARINDYEILANPNLGEETDEDTVIQGYFKLKESLGGAHICACCADAAFVPAVSAAIDIPVWPLTQYIKMYQD